MALVFSRVHGAMHRSNRLTARNRNPSFQELGQQCCCSSSFVKTRTPTRFGNAPQPQHYLRLHNPIAASSVEAPTPDASVGSPAPTSAGTTGAAATQPDPWQHMLDLQASGDAVECTVTGYNKGGVLVQVQGLRGFIPYSKLERSRLVAGHQGELDYLVGQTLTAQVIQVDIQSLRKEVVLSEVAVGVAGSLRRLAAGQVVSGVVRALQDYGAFVEVQPAEGGVAVQGLVHTSELSWGKVMSVNSVLAVGESVRLVVLDSDPVKGRLSLSLRRMQQDPLKQNLDTMLPSGQDKVEWSEVMSAPLVLAPIILQLKSLEGVEDVSLGRQAQNPSHAAPEMQLFLSRENREDGGVVLVARTGPLLQELRLKTSLTRDEVKQKMQLIMLPKAVADAPAAEPADAAPPPQA